MTRPTTTEHIIRAMLRDQRSNIANFIDDWKTTLETHPESWMVKIDGSIRLLAVAFAQELERLIEGEAESQEWMETLEHINLLRAALYEHLLRVQPQLHTCLPISGPGPHGIADKTFAFLVDAAWQFGSSLGQLRKNFPPRVQIVAG